MKFCVVREKTTGYYLSRYTYHEQDPTYGEHTVSCREFMPKSEVLGLHPTAGLVIFETQESAEKFIESPNYSGNYIENIKNALEIVSLSEIETL